MHNRPINLHINLHINLQRNFMSKLTDLVTAALAGLQSKLNTGNGAVTPADIVAKVHEVIDPQVAALNDAITAIHATDDDTTKKLADVTDAVTQFLTDLAPASTPASPPAANTNAPAPAPAETAPAPSPEPTPEPAPAPAA